jgi:OmpA-OmpF porin, OOP family
MAIDLLRLAKTYLTPDVVQNVSGVVNEPPATTQKALEGVIPALLGGMANTAASPGGAGTLMNMINTGGYGENTLTNISSRLTGGALDNTLNSGSTLISSLFGGSTRSVTSALSRQLGLDEGKISTLMSLAGPLILGLLGREVRDKHLSASGLSGLLQDQKSTIASYLPTSVANLFTGGPVRGAADTAHTEVGRGYAAASETVSGGAGGGSALRWLLPLLLLFAAGLAMFSWMRRPAERGGIRTASLSLPGGSVTVPEDSTAYSLARYLSNPDDRETPKHFVLDKVTFETASATLTRESAVAIANLATVLGAYPAVKIGIEGHTDNVGTPEASRTLSLQRANAVRDALVERGVAAGRITTEGYGAGRPIVSNETPDGQAKNRRTELVVTAR